MATTDPFGGLNGTDRDAYVAITNMLKAYNLESLAPAVLGFIQNGYSSDTINVLIQNTPEYQQRFAANEARRQKGLPVLSPAEYLATETAYRQIMSSAGLPVGFYDQPSDFTSWLSNDVSPVEVQQRVQAATDLVNNVDPATRQTFEQWYSTGDLIAYALDRERSTTILDRQIAAAKVGGAAADQGVNLGQQTAEALAAQGVTQQQAQQGFGVVSELGRTAQRLSDLYGGDYTQTDAIGEVFLADQAATVKRRKLASQERAQFEGSAGLGRTSLRANTAGQL